MCLEVWSDTVGGCLPNYSWLNALQVRYRANWAPMCPKSTNRAAWLFQSRQMFYCCRGELWSTTSLSPCHGIKDGIYVQALSASLWQRNGVCSNDLLRISLINGATKAKVWTRGASKVSFCCWGRLNGQAPREKWWCRGEVTVDCWHSFKLLRCEMLATSWGPRTPLWNQF